MSQYTEQTAPLEYGCKPNKMGKTVKGQQRGCSAEWRSISDGRSISDCIADLPLETWFREMSIDKVLDPLPSMPQHETSINKSPNSSVNYLGNVEAKEGSPTIENAVCQSIAGDCVLTATANNSPLPEKDYLGGLDDKVVIDYDFLNPCSPRQGTLEYMLGDMNPYQKSPDALLLPECPTRIKPPAKAQSNTQTERTDLDVLLGRGGLTNRHAGNIRFRNEAQRLKEWYHCSTKAEKYHISEILVRQVHSEGGRFLAQDATTELWYEVTNKRARKKASQVLREEKKKH